MPTPQSTPRTALYARVSTRDRQDPQNQIDALQAYAAHAGLEVVAEYVDRESGSNTDRPQFQRMMADAARRNFDLLIFWSLDRLTRSGVKTTLDILQTLQRYGVRFRSLQQPELDTTGPWADVIIAIFAALAKLERELLRERTRAGLQRARRQGKALGRPRAIASAGRMQMMRKSGKSYDAIAAELGISAATVRRRLQATAQTTPAPANSAAATSSIAPVSPADGTAALATSPAESATEPAKSWK